MPNEEFLTKEQIKHAFENEGFGISKSECVSSISYTKDYFKKLFPFPFFNIIYLYNLFDWVLDITPLRKKFGSFIYGYFKRL